MEWFWTNGLILKLPCAISCVNAIDTILRFNNCKLKPNITKKTVAGIEGSGLLWKCDLWPKSS